MFPPNSVRKYHIFQYVQMHSFVVTLRAKKASPGQNRGLRTKKKFEGIPRVTHGTRRTRTRDTRNTAVQYYQWDNVDINRKGCTEEEANLDHARLPTKIALQQHACITQQQRPAALQIAGSDKKTPQSRKPQQYSADRLPCMRDVASCSAGGWPTCIAL